MLVIGSQQSKSERSSDDTHQVLYVLLGRVRLEGMEGVCSENAVRWEEVDDEF